MVDFQKSVVWKHQQSLEDIYNINLRSEKYIYSQKHKRWVSCTDEEYNNRRTQGISFTPQTPEEFMSSMGIGDPYLDHGLSKYDGISCRIFKEEPERVPMGYSLMKTLEGVYFSTKTSDISCTLSYMVRDKNIPEETTLDHKYIIYECIPQGAARKFRAKILGKPIPKAETFHTIDILEKELGCDVLIITYLDSQYLVANIPIVNSNDYTIAYDIVSKVIKVTDIEDIHDENNKVTNHIILDFVAITNDIINNKTRIDDIRHAIKNLFMLTYHDDDLIFNIDKKYIMKHCEYTSPISKLMADLIRRSLNIITGNHTAIKAKLQNIGLDIRDDAVCKNFILFMGYKKVGNMYKYE